jgi:hypothetical protein
VATGVVVATEEDCRNQFSTFLFDDSCLFSERLRDFSPDADSSTTSSRGFPLGGRDENCPPAVGGGGILVDFLEEGVGIFEPVPPEVGEGLLLAERTVVLIVGLVVLTGDVCLGLSRSQR